MDIPAGDLGQERIERATAKVDLKMLWVAGQHPSDSISDCWVLEGPDLGLGPIWIRG